MTTALKYLVEFPRKITLSVASYRFKVLAHRCVACSGYKLLICVLCKKGSENTGRYILPPLRNFAPEILFPSGHT